MSSVPATPLGTVARCGSGRMRAAGLEASMRETRRRLRGADCLATRCATWHSPQRGGSTSRIDFDDRARAPPPPPPPPGRPAARPPGRPAARPPAAGRRLRPAMAPSRGPPTHPTRRLFPPPASFSARSCRIPHRHPLPSVKSGHFRATTRRHARCVLTVGGPDCLSEGASHEGVHMCRGYRGGASGGASGSRTSR